MQPEAKVDWRQKAGCSCLSFWTIDEDSSLKSFWVIDSTHGAGRNKASHDGYLNVFADAIVESAVKRRLERSRIRER